MAEQGGSVDTLIYEAQSVAAEAFKVLRGELILRGKEIIELRTEIEKLKTEAACKPSD